jgi:hypothetical protein
MRYLRATPALLLAATLAACGDDSPTLTQASVGPSFARGGVAPTNFNAVLEGSNEIPLNDSPGRGLAHFQLDPTRTEVRFRLNAANIENVTQAHIHCGSATVNGPVVVFLYGLGPTVSPNGQLSDGTFTAANVIARPASAVCPGGIANFDDLLEKMETGGAYVNAHTTAIPAGEIRGQINPAGPVNP